MLMFTLDEMLTPIWDTDVVYGESLTMYREKNGEISAPLLYTPTEILEVRGADLQTLYREGTDYCLRDGRLFLPQGSTIPYMEYEEIFMPQKLHEACFPYPGGYLLFHEGHFFHDRQLAVTYRCRRGEWQGYTPKWEKETLARTVARLEQGKPLKIVLFGDSISAGGNASGLTGANPYQPRFSELLLEGLRGRFGGEITMENPSVGGRDSAWAAETLDERVISRSPDLVILGFGMNDKTLPDVFAEDTRRMTERIRAALPDADILLIATSTPNPILTADGAKFMRYQPLYGEALKPLVREGIALLDMGALQKELHRKKRFIDTTANNVNHPCDFFIRIHAQALAAMLMPRR